MNHLKAFIGKKLKKDILSTHGAFLLSANTILKEEHIQKLYSYRITLTEEDIAPLSVTNQRSAKNGSTAEKRKKIEQATEHMKDLLYEVKIKKQVPIMDVKNHILPAIEASVDKPDLFDLFHSVKALDDYTYRHNIGVASIATLIGKWMKLDEQELSLLSLSAILHDVGKMKVPEEILNKPGKLTAEEFEVMKKHTIYGYELIKNTVGTSYRCALVALQHHEREDGRGYPLGIKSGQIDPLSKIVAVADVFHAMTSKRVYHDARPFYQVMKEMQHGEFGKLDPQIIHLFLSKIMNSLVGQEVLLTDGRRAKIVLVDPKDPANPLIQVEEAFLDLSKNDTVFIEEVY